MRMDTYEYKQSSIVELSVEYGCLRDGVSHTDEGPIENGLDLRNVQCTTMVNNM